MIRVECYGEEEMEIGYQKDIDDLAIILTPDYDYDTRTACPDPSCGRRRHRRL